MKGFEEIQQLWQKQKPDPAVSFDTVLQRIKSDKSALAKKLFWQSIVPCLVIIGLVWISLTVAFATWTTYLAVSIVIGCLCYYTVNQLIDYRQLSDSQSLLSKPQQYIHYLQGFQQRRNRFNTRHYSIYEACIALAFALYAVEMYFALSFWFFVSFIVFVVFWFLICHFVFMKQYIRQENSRIQQMIEDLQRIHEQFRDEDPADGR